MKRILHSTTVSGFITSFIIEQWDMYFILLQYINKLCEPYFYSNANYLNVVLKVILIYFQVECIKKQLSWD
jgi:hypothetical protein